MNGLPVMINKELLHLGQRVLYGDERVDATVNALTQTEVGLIVGDDYIIGDYEDVYVED